MHFYFLLLIHQVDGHQVYTTYKLESVSCSDAALVRTQICPYCVEPKHNIRTQRTFAWRKCQHKML